MTTIINRAVKKIEQLFAPETVSCEGVVLPASKLRQGGGHFRQDADFLSSARHEADRLVKQCGVTETSSVLDVGCGVGRLPIGLIDRVGALQAYRGIDVNPKAISWCQRHITPSHPTYQFILSEAKNARYRPNGQEISSAQARLPFENDLFDVIYLYSVFSHMVPHDVRFYLNEFARVLRPSGYIFLTGFIEEDVPDMSINPENYRRQWIGPLHCVRYERSFFLDLITTAGFVVDQFDYETETDGQSGLYLCSKQS